MRRLAAAGIVVATGGCARGRPTVEEQIRTDLGRQLGVRVERVRCPAGVYPKTCSADLPGTAGVELTVSETPRGIEWSLAGFVIATAPLAVAIGIELDDLGLEAEVECGPSYVVTRVGDRVPCTLKVAGVRGAAWARINDESGRFDLELALDPVAVAARTTDIDLAELERLSRALDRDDAEDLEDGDAASATASDAASGAAARSRATP